MKTKEDITYINFDTWNNRVLKVGIKALLIIVLIEILLFFLFKPTIDFSKKEYFISFVLLPTIFQIMIIMYMGVITKILSRFLNQSVISMLLIIGEIAFVIVAVAVHSSVSFICIVLLHPIMFTSVYKKKFFGWFACCVAILGYGLIEFGIIPSTEYKVENTEVTYFIVFATLVTLTTIWTLAMKKVNVEFTENAERLREEANNMKYVAERDLLTNLYNHNTFYKKLDEKINNRNNESLNIIVIDIDDFKKINDTYGHVAGDKVIINLANIVKESLSEFDFAGRYGGEEFVGVYTGINEKEIISIAEKIKEQCRNSIVKYKVNDNEEYDINYTVSIGVSTYTNEMETGTELFECADKGLYKAKHSGKNRVVYCG